MASDKIDKKVYSQKVNDLFGLTGEDVIDWSRLKVGDLIQFYAMVLNPKDLSKMGMNIADQVLPEKASELLGGMAEEGILGLVKDRPIIQALLGRVAKRIDKTD